MSALSGSTHSDIIQNSLNMFTYFEEWDSTTLKECCALSKMKKYSKDQTILGDGVGFRNYVYFIVTGKCQVIEHLLVTAKVTNGTKRYKLFKPPETEIELPKIEITEEKVEEEPKVLAEVKVTEIRDTIEEIKIMDGMDETDDPEADKELNTNERGNGGQNPGTDANQPDTEPVTSSTPPKKKELKIVEPNNTTNLPSKPAPVIANIDLPPPNVETHFMQVCFLNPTACFGIGENMNNRRVIATTETQCLLIPRIWLLQKNSANLWIRVQQFLKNNIPTTEQVFREFVSKRKWMVHSKKIVYEIVSKRKNRSNNLSVNVPYFIRINEEIDAS